MSNLTKQDLSDMVFINKMGWMGYDYNPDDVKLIRKVLSQEGIEISAAEAIEFWRWRSDKYDASWLTVRPQEDIVRWFDEFLSFNLSFLEDEKDQEDQEE